MPSRRDFLLMASAWAMAGAARRVQAKGKREAKNAPKPKPLSILLIANPFLGQQCEAAARQRGHEVTAVRRVVRAGVQTLHVDTRKPLDVEGRHWDAVIDTSVLIPSRVADLEPVLSGRADYYLLLSSTSVYAKLDHAGADETAPLARTTEPDAMRPTDENASALRVLCEQAAEKLLPERVGIVRAGLIVGPGDSTHRFAYWPLRVARGGEVLAPGKPGDFVQFIDVRDLADFMVRCAEHKTTGVFNVDGPPTTMGTLLETCRKVSKSNATFVWASADFLEKKGVRPYRDVPVWVPATGDFAGFGRISSAKALAAGLHYRPLAETISDTLAWHATLPPEQQNIGGLSPKQESDLLKALHAGTRAPAS